MQTACLYIFEGLLYGDWRFFCFVFYLNVLTIGEQISIHHKAFQAIQVQHLFGLDGIDKNGMLSRRFQKLLNNMPLFQLVLIILTLRLHKSFICIVLPDFSFLISAPVLIISCFCNSFLTFYLHDVIFFLVLISLSLIVLRF